MEKKFRSNRSFKSRFHNVRKFVKLSRKIFNRFKKSKFRFFKPIKNKRSKRSFKFAKLNYFLSKRRTLSNSFLIKKRFKKFKRFSKKFKPKSKHKRFYRPKKKFNYHKKWPYYSQKTPPKPKKLKRALSKVRKTYRKLKSKILKRFKRGTKKKLFFLRKSFLSNSPNFSDTAAKKRIISSYLIKRFSIYNFEKNKRNYNLRRLNKPSLRFRLKKALRLKTPARPLKKRKNKRKNRYKKYRSKHNNQKNKRNFRFFQKWKKRRIRYPFWKIRFSPIQETSKRSSQFIFFNPQNASTSSNFIRYSFYNFLGKILSFQIFKNFGLPVSIKFNLFPLHRANTDFYLNFITTKLYYRYILSDVIKPIVRLSLKFYRGFVIHCRGRFTRAQMAVSKKFIKKSVSYSKISSSLDYGQKDVVLKYGTCNLKIWIRK